MGLRKMILVLRNRVVEQKVGRVEGLGCKFEVLGSILWFLGGHDICCKLVDLPWARSAFPHPGSKETYRLPSSQRSAQRRLYGETP